MYYICIIDSGGVHGSVQGVEYHCSQQHLIRLKERITNVDVDQLLQKMRKTRKDPQIIGSWSTLEDGFPNVIEYENLNL